MIGVIFGLFGSALSTLLSVKEMSWYYTGLAALIALVVNLLVSFLLRGKWNVRYRNRIKVISIVLFLGLLVTVYMHTKYFLECTFAYEDFEQVGYYIKGDVYTADALKFKADNPHIVEDGDLVKEGFSLAEKNRVWTPESIRRNTLKLISSYSFCVIFFVGIISILLEVLMGHYGRSMIKSIETV